MCENKNLSSVFSLSPGLIREWLKKTGHVLIEPLKFEFETFRIVVFQRTSRWLLLKFKMGSEINL